MHGTCWAVASLVVMTLGSPAGTSGQLPEGGVVVVRTTTTDASREISRSLRARLAERGIAVGQDVLTLPGNANGVTPLRDKGIGVVVALGADASVLVRHELPDMPVVTAMVVRSELQGVGVSLDFPVDVQLQWIRRLLPPEARRIGVLYSPGANARIIARMREVAREYAMTIEARSVNSPADIPTALASLTSVADVLWAIPDDVVMTTETARSILLFSMRNRLPLIGLSHAWVRAGALFSLDRDYEDVGVQLADQVVRLLKGESESAMRPEGPRKVVYAVNQRTAELMGMRLPPDVLRNAREVVR